MTAFIKIKRSTVISCHPAVHHPRCFPFAKSRMSSDFLSYQRFVFVFLVDLLGLLKWRSNTSLLQQNLRQLMKVEGGEVVKVSGRRGFDTAPTALHPLKRDGKQNIPFAPSL